MICPWIPLIPAKTYALKLNSALCYCSLRTLCLPSYNFADFNNVQWTSRFIVFRHICFVVCRVCNVAMALLSVITTLLTGLGIVVGFTEGSIAEKVQ